MNRKQKYSTPETQCLVVWTEVTFCQSGNLPDKLVEDDLFEEEFS